MFWWIGKARNISGNIAKFLTGLGYHISFHLQKKTKDTYSKPTISRLQVQILCLAQQDWRNG
jgi:hypothetical protein